jgi:hypothetical protein
MAMIIDEEAMTPVEEELLLRDEDFPSTFVNKAHPQDYILSASSIVSEYIFHEYRGLRHPRLIWRVSYKLGEHAYMPISFVLDTGAPKMYLCSHLMNILIERELVVKDHDMEVVYMMMLGHKFVVEETPEGHAPANIMGLRALCTLGLQLFREPNYGFTFPSAVSFLQK